MLELCLLSLDKVKMSSWEFFFSWWRMSNIIRLNNENSSWLFVFILNAARRVQCHNYEDCCGVLKKHLGHRTFVFLCVILERCPIKLLHIISIIIQLLNCARNSLVGSQTQPDCTVLFCLLQRKSWGNFERRWTLRHLSRSLRKRG